MLAGGSPRYHLYPAKDGKIVACGAIEQKFWLGFCTAIGLAGGIHQRLARSGGDARCRRETHRGAQCRTNGGRSLPRPIAARPIVVPLEQAMRDPHFVGRGLVRPHKIESASGKMMPGAAAADLRRSFAQAGREKWRRQPGEN